MDREELVTVRIAPDDDCQNPRTDFDHADVMYCRHNHYNLGDEGAEDPYEEIEGTEVDGVWLNTDELSYIIDMLEGIDLDEGEFLERGDQKWTAFDFELMIAQLSDPRNGLEERHKLRDDVAIIMELNLYDHSGITISHGSFGCPWDSGQVGWHYITKKALQDEWGGDEALALKYMQAVLSEYDDYLRGNCWGFDIDGPDGINNGCWGFIGDDSLDAMLEHVEERFHDAMRAAWEWRFDNKPVYCTVGGVVVDPDEIETLTVRKIANSFMKPQIEETDYYLADTSHGDEVIPADVIDLPLAVGEFYEAKNDDEDPDWFDTLQYLVAGELYGVERQHGFIARMSAPGYIDCTEWSCHTFYDAAAEFLAEMYGEEDE